MNKLKVFLIQSLFTSIAFFSKLFTSNVSADSVSEDIIDMPLAGVVEVPTPEDTIKRALGYVIIALIPIGFIILTTLFVKRTFFTKEKANKKSKKK